MYFLFSVAFINISSAQQQSLSETEEFKKKYITASYYYLYEEYENAIPLLLELYDMAPTNAAVNYKLGVSYLQIKGEKEKALPFLEFAAKHSSPKANEFSYKETLAPELAWYRLGEVFHVINDFDKATESYKRFKSFLKPNDIYNLDIVNRQIETCKNAKQLVKYPVMVVKNNLGRLVRTPFYAYSPVVSADQSTLVFTTEKLVIPDSSELASGAFDEYIEEIFYSKKVNGEWTEAVNITNEINSNGYCSSVFISSDGTHLLLMKDDYFDGNIYETKYIDGKWTPITKLHKNVNSKSWEMHACLTKDGKTLYFSSDRKGGFGGFDIYKSNLQENGEWGKAINLGPTINTKYDDDTPFILEDNRTLYFSSEGHYNMGGFDIFHTKLLDNNKWSVPLNLGYPVNTADDNLFYYPVKNGEYTYFSDAKIDGNGGTEIYMMKLLLPEHPNQFEINGTITFADNPKSNSVVTISIIDSLSKNDTVATVFSNLETGEYQGIVPSGNYKVAFVAEGYKKRCEELFIPQILSRQEFVLNTELSPEELLSSHDLIAQNQESKDGYVAIKNINFSTKEQTLDFDSQVELERMYKILASNPSLSIVLEGKTKTEFGEAYDQKLNEKRQETIINYLAKKGIDKSRFVINNQEIAQNNALSEAVEIKLLKSTNDSILMNEEIYLPENVRFKNELVYTVILLGTNGQLADNYFEKYKDILTVTPYTTQNGYIYTSGKFDKLFDAVKYMNSAIDMGFLEASIVDNFELENIRRSSYLATSESTTHNTKVDTTSSTIVSKGEFLFVIQIGAYENSVGIEHFKNLEGIVEHKGSDGKYRYLFGKFATYKEAKEKRMDLIRNGYSDSFIMNYERYK
ncbi:MAG: hypothetical protein A2W98_06000 [Bacteroidetes bacterium GWF2_33_38]|nr:MAG: hypothetical protein A2W98_06000 [Bacteroidetes bacterium GWF2_33_38]OFY72740.1 MAG: hypothetical protein A2265_02840 [Bacteroidetes bacterium RIFOXYA12_FULL_33_9]OFY90568.1 MAG: hypothetical protein A2236_05600 [Bacteroidetes bacterium RIFOXYA2_FULL_33_7]